MRRKRYVTIPKQGEAAKRAFAAGKAEALKPEISAPEAEALEPVDFEELTALTEEKEPEENEAAEEPEETKLPEAPEDDVKSAIQEEVNPVEEAGISEEDKSSEENEVPEEEKASSEGEVPKGKEASSEAEVPEEKEPPAEKEIPEASEEIKTSAEKETSKAPEETEETNAPEENAAAKEQDENGSARKEKKKRTGTVLLAAAVLLLGAYAQQAFFYRTHFFPGTTAYGVDISRLNVEEAKRAIAEEKEAYTISVKARGFEDAVLTGAQYDLKMDFGDGLSEALSAPERQSVFAWFAAEPEDLSEEAEMSFHYDVKKLRAAIRALPLFDRDLIEKPRDAHLGEYEEGVGFRVVLETEGNYPNTRKTIDLIEAALSVERIGASQAGKAETVDLEAGEVYERPKVFSDDPALNRMAEELNRYCENEITVKLGGTLTRTIGGNELRSMLERDESGALFLSADRIRAYVDALSEETDTAGTVRRFDTSYGGYVELKGPFGWKIDRAATTEALKALIETGNGGEFEPVFSRKASWREPDWGNTYVEVNLAAQHLYFYKDGKQIVSSDFVSGNVARGDATPPGIFSLSYKQRDKVLRGAIQADGKPEYESPVTFWMPFNGGIGFHDASWRGSYGGSIYRRNGSHGCINMPYARAKELFQNIEKGVPVICYDTAPKPYETPKETAAPGEPETKEAEGNKPEAEPKAQEEKAQSERKKQEEKPQESGKAQPETKAPEKKVPETKAPETKAPETKAQKPPVQKPETAVRPQETNPVSPKPDPQPETDAAAESAAPSETEAQGAQPETEATAAEAETEPAPEATLPSGADPLPYTPVEGEDGGPGIALLPGTEASVTENGPGEGADFREPEAGALGPGEEMP